MRGRSGRGRQVAAHELVVDGRAYPLNPRGPTRLAPPPEGDVPVGAGVLWVGPGDKAGQGVPVENRGTIAAFVGSRLLAPGARDTLLPGEALGVGGTLVRLRRAVRPRSRWPARLGLAAACGVLLLAATALGPDPEPPFDLDAAVARDYPAAVAPLAEARLAEARDDAPAARRAYRAARDAILVELARRGARPADRPILDALAGPSGGAD